MSAALSLVSPENPKERINWHCSERRLFLCQRGRRKRHAVTKGCQPHSCLAGESRCSCDSRLWKAERQTKIVVTLFVLTTFILLFLLLPTSSPFISVRIPFPSCLLIGVVPHHLFLHRAYRSAPWADVFQQHLEALVGRPPGCSKNSYTPNTTCGPVQPNRGFHYVDDGEQSSFLSPHKSVGGHVL